MAVLTTLFDLVKGAIMIRLLDNFFEYVAVRDQRERLMMQLAVVAVVVAVINVIAIIVYAATR